MQTNPRKAPSVTGNRRLWVTARRLARGWALVLVVLLSPAAGNADPASQLTVAQSGVRLRLGMFALGVDWVTMTVIIENERDRRVWLGVVTGGDKQDTTQAVLSDEHGKSCKAAANPGGIAEIPPLQEAKQAPATVAMTQLSARSSLNVVFDFPQCRLSRTSLLSLTAVFALSTNRREIERYPMTFWGIVQKTRMR